MNAEGESNDGSITFLSKQVDFIVEEIDKFKSKLSKAKKSNLNEGFLIENQYKDRNDSLKANYSSPLPPADESVKLLRRVLSSLSNGPLSEKQLLSSMNSEKNNLEDINICCEILSAVGAIEKHDPTQPASSNDNSFCTMMDERWGIKSDSATLDTPRGGEKDLLAPDKGKQEPTPETATNLSDASSINGQLKGYQSVTVKEEGQSLAPSQDFSPDVVPSLGLEIPPTVQDLTTMSVFSLDPEAPSDASVTSHHVSANMSIAHNNTNHNTNNAGASPGFNLDGRTSSMEEYGALPGLSNLSGEHHLLDSFEFGETGWRDSLFASSANSVATSAPNVDEFEDSVARDNMDMNQVMEHPFPVERKRGSASSAAVVRFSNMDEKLTEREDLNRDTGDSAVWCIKRYLRRGDISQDSNKSVSLLFDPEKAFSRLGEMTCSAVTAAEVEEKLLRKLVGQCDICLPTKPFRTNTHYLNQEVNSSSSVKASADWVLHGGLVDTGDRESLVISSVIGRDPTAADLFEKIRATKRQRGACLQVGNSVDKRKSYYNALKVSELETVSNTTIETYWSSLVGKGVGESSLEENSCAKTKNPAIFTSTHISEKSVTNNTSLTSTSTPLPLSPRSQRRYCLAQYMRLEYQPMPRRSAEAVNLICSQPMSLPDLYVPTTVIPWESVASEFSLVMEGEEGGLVYGETLPGLKIDTALEEVAAELEVEEDAEEVEEEVVQELGENSKTPSTSSLNTVKKKRRLRQSIDVLSPTFREVSSMTFGTEARRVSFGAMDSSGSVYIQENTAVAETMEGEKKANVDDEDDDASEDLSDAAVLARHEAVLSGMREKWALIQKLKDENRREVVTPGGSIAPHTTTVSVKHANKKNGQSAVKELKEGNSAVKTAVTAPVCDDKGISNCGKGLPASLPRKRARTAGLTSSQVKRRGRPPKLARSSHIHGDVHSGSENIESSDEQ